MNGSACAVMSKQNKKYQSHLVRIAAKNEMKIIIIDGSITLVAVIACVHYAGMRAFRPSSNNTAAAAAASSSSFLVHIFNANSI